MILKDKTHSQAKAQTLRNVTVEKLQQAVKHVENKTTNTQRFNLQKQQYEGSVVILDAAHCFCPPRLVITVGANEPSSNCCLFAHFFCIMSATANYV